jgi:hypothetical protein
MRKKYFEIWIDFELADMARKKEFETRHFFSLMKKTCCFDMNRTKELIGYSIHDLSKKFPPFFQAL